MAVGAQSLTLYDFSDPEFLAVCQDVQNAFGYFKTTEVSDRLNLDVKHPNNNVGIRLGWLKRYGVVEREEDKESDYYRHWRLTEEGAAVVNAHLNPNQRRAMEGLGIEQSLEVAKLLTDRYQVSGRATANLVRRQIQYGFQPRR